MEERLKQNRNLDRFIAGDMSGSELREFQEAIAADKALADRLALRRRILAGIRKASDRRLKALLVSIIGYRKSTVPFGLKLLLTFLVLVVCGSLVWNYLGTESNVSRKAFDLSRLVRKATRIVSKQEPSTEKVVRKRVVEKDTSLESIVDTSAIAAITSVESDSAIATEQEEIVVRKDQLLISTQITVEDRSSSTRRNNLAADAARQLNPAAGLPEEKQSTDRIEVEFWVNPVNYKGYRWFNGKLVLFGIDRPDDVQLFRIDDLFYMKSEGETYELVQTADLQGYRTLRDPDKMKALK